jgi:hypothetical protein
MLLAYLLSQRTRIAGTVQMRRVIQELEMRKPELKRIVAALRQLPPAQRKVVALELGALETQSTATLIVEGRFAN